MAYPSGQLWIFDPGDPPAVTYDRLPPYADMLYVHEDYRRQGIATALLNAALARWPNLLYDAGTESGDKFLDAFETRLKKT